MGQKDLKADIVKLQTEIEEQKSGHADEIKKLKAAQKKAITDKDKTLEGKLKTLKESEQIL